MVVAVSGKSAPPVDTKTLLATFHEAGPYNPASFLLPKVIKHVLALEISKLRGVIWSEEMLVSDMPNATCRIGKPPVKDVKVWLNTFPKPMAAFMFPKKASELWAYQTTVMKAAYNY